MAEDDVAQTLGAMGSRLRAVRERRGVTLADVSRATGISSSTLSRTETGRRKSTLEVVLQLAKEYEVSLDELAGTAPAPAAEPRSTAPHSFGDDKAVLPLTGTSAVCTPTSISCQPSRSRQGGPDRRLTKATSGCASCTGGCGSHSAARTSS